MEKEDIYHVYQNSQGELKQIKKRFSFLGGLFHLSAGGLLIIAAVTGLVLFLIAVFTYVWFARDIYSKDRLMNRNNSGVTLLDRKDQPFFTFYQATRATYVPLSDIPKITQQAVIAVEDKEFYEHSGFSIQAIIRSVLLNIQREELAYGGSTITQQLVKNALLNSKKNFLRKYQELILATEIDRVYEKDEILEMYLNSSYFGEGAIGIEEASQTYFGKKVQNLSLAESAMLAGILNAPSALSPLSNDPAEAYERQEFVLEKMLEQGYISESEKSNAVEQKLVFKSRVENLNQVAPHFALMVKDELEKMYGGEESLARSGLKVKTTLDVDWQKYAETVVQNHVNSLAKNKATNGSVVVIDPMTGEIKVMVGSKDWYNQSFGKINMALAPRQPGSSFKPIVYGAAIEKKLITPATVLKDEEKTFGINYKPKNYDGKYRGDVLVRRALANSLNIPAVEVMEKLGVSSALQKARDMGITKLKTTSDYGMSLVLGSGEVPLLELTNAYSTFATYGTIHNTKSIIQITDKDGKVIYKAKDAKKQVLSAEAAYLISSILSDNKARQEVFGNSLTLSRPAAVKTGTTEDYRDALTVGYTPSIVVGVWVGNSDYKAMDKIAGSMGAAPIWRSLMEKFLAGTQVEDFKPQGNITSTMVCGNKGLRAVEEKDSNYQEYFLAGTEPKELCGEPEPTLEPEPTDKPDEKPTEEPEPTKTPKATPTSSPSSSPTVTATPTQTPIILPLPNL